MIIPENKNHIVTNVQNGRSASIKATAKAFKILSSLYPNPIEGAVREVCCNAYDSHVEAGKADVPFYIHLPNELEPWFAVQDFGVGLSKESIVGYPTTIKTVNQETGDVEEIETWVPGLYNTFFESTKTDSNDFTGALGLGCKAPYGYTEQFSITSVYDGVESLYNAVVGVEGGPEIHHISDKNTDACNGVTVRFAVKKSDIQRFRDTAAQILIWFSTKPSTNDPSFRVVDISEYDNHDDFMIIPNGVLETSTPRVLMGNVLYKVDGNVHADYMRKAGCDGGVIPHFNYYGGDSLILKFPLGELDIAPARDYILSDPTSSKNFISKLESVEKSIIPYMQSQIDKCEDITDFRLFANKQKVISRFDEEFTFKGLPLRSYDITLPYTDFKSLRVITPKGGIAKVDTSSIWVEGYSETPVVFIKDAKKSVLHNRSELACEYSITKYMLLQVDEKDSKALLDRLAILEPVVERLSDRIKAGKVAPKTQKRGGGLGHKAFIYNRDNNKMEMHHFPMASIKEFINDCKGTVWVDGQCMLDGVDNLSEYAEILPEGDELIVLNESNADKIINRYDNVKRYVYMPLPDEVAEEVEAYKRQDIYNIFWNGVEVFLEGDWTSLAEIIESSDADVNEYLNHEYLYMKPKYKISRKHYSYNRQVQEIIKKVEEEPQKDYKETAEKLNKFFTSLVESYPLLKGFKNREISEEEKEELRLYIWAKDTMKSQKAA